VSYPKSEERYAGGGQVKYLVYHSPQPLRTGETQERTRVKRLYFPANAKDIKVDGPGTVEKRTGTRVHGVKVHYQYKLGGTTAHRGKTTYKVPERWADRTKVVELPQGAKDIRLTERPPEGPKMAVA
jgi:hypothetical protein